MCIRGVHTHTCVLVHSVQVCARVRIVHTYTPTYSTTCNLYCAPHSKVFYMQVFVFIKQTHYFPLPELDFPSEIFGFIDNNDARLGVELARTIELWAVCLRCFRDLEASHAADVLTK